MRVVATTVVRESVFGRQETGYVYDIDLVMYLLTTVLDGRNTPLGDGVQRALGRAPRDFSDYARRAAATYDTLVRYDDGWQIADVVESPLFAGLHGSPGTARRSG
jgi:hypothetical protein